MPETRCLVPRYHRLNLKASSDPPFDLSRFDILDSPVVVVQEPASDQVSGAWTAKLNATVETISAPSVGKVAVWEN